MKKYLIFIRALLFCLITNMDFVFSQGYNKKTCIDTYFKKNVNSLDCNRKITMSCFRKIRMY